MEQTVKAIIATWAQKLIRAEFLVLAFLLPLFFLPVTTEFYEFNKLTLLTVGVFLGALAWGIRAIIIGKLETRRSPFDWPVLIFWIAAVVSTIFSDNRLTSIIGQYARWYPSLFTATIFTAFYFLVSWNLDAKTLRRMVWAILASAVAAALLFWIRYFGVNIFGQTWSSQPTFTPLGSPTVLALFLGAVSGLALPPILEARKIWSKIATSALLLVFPLTLILIGASVGWLSFALSMGLAFFKSPIAELAKAKWQIIAVAGSALVFAGVFFIPTFFGKKTFLNRDFPSEVTLNLQTSWSVSATSFRQKPFWGSGPATFSMDFTRYKPLRFNQSSYWTVRFDKPFNGYLLTFAEEGLLGILTWLFLITIFIRTSLRTGGWIWMPVGAAVLAALLLTNETIVSAFLLYLALASLNPRENGDIPTEPMVKRQGGALAAGMVAIALAVLGTVITYRAYAAETLQRTARNSDNLAQAYSSMIRSASEFPWQPAYRLMLSQTSFLTADELAKKENPTVNDTNQIKGLVAQAISEARAAADLNPISVGNWESLAQIYRSLIGLAKDAEQWAVDSYQKAITLDLFNPLLRISFGGLYYQLGQFSPAAEQFRAAVNLKPNYANAHYNLGRAYKELGETKLAIQELETALQLSDPSVEGYKEAKQLLDELKAE